MNPVTPRPWLFVDFFRDLPLSLSARPLHGDSLPAPDRGQTGDH